MKRTFNPMEALLVLTVIGIVARIFIFESKQAARQC